MQWLKITIHTVEEAEDSVSGVLYDLGIESLEIEDRVPVPEEANGGLFGEVLPDLPEDDHQAAISFYLDEKENAEEVLLRIRTAMAEVCAENDFPPMRIETSCTKDEDWVNNWKKYFHQFHVDDILIIPSWEKEERTEEASLVLHIDPGTAFGTGKHETTQLAIRALGRNIKEGARLLDIGTGSGILSIIALKEGAAEAVGTDIDENVLPAIADNMKNNAIAETKFRCFIGNIADDADVQAKVGGGYDLVTANIIAEILKQITPEVPKHLKKGGIYILSGILNEKEDLVRNCLAASGMTVLAAEHMGDWVCLTAKNG